MEENKINALMDMTVSKIRQLVDADTIIGKPISTPDGITVIPVSRMSFGIGTGGTLSGIGETLKALNPHIEIWAVEPENAAILSGGAIGTHLQMGIGDGLIPDNLNQDIYDDLYLVTDEEAIQTAKDLARLEGLMCGISSGTNVAAALKLAKKLGPGKTVVTILPDTAERYFSTPLFQE